VVTEDVVLYIVVRRIPEVSCGHWGRCAVHFSAQHPKSFLCSLGTCYTFWCALGMLCHAFWCATSRKVLVVTEDVVLYIVVRSIPEVSCGHWGSGAIHFSAHHPRRFLWPLGMFFRIVWCIVFETLVLTFRAV